MFSPGQEEHCAPTKEPVKYGELVVLGYNGSLPNGDRGRRKSRFALYKRAKANGVKPSTVHILNTPQASKCLVRAGNSSVQSYVNHAVLFGSERSEAVNCKGQHSISYTLSRNQTVVVEYSHDNNTDMFQIGRSTEGPIDYVVTDTVSGGGDSEETPITQSTISRFACRVVCERNPPFTARIYAAGFDSSKNIFLGVESESNILQDGSLVDLCGATLLWRTAEGLFHTPTQKHLEALRQELNAARPQCPVGLNTLAFPSMQRCSRALSNVPSQEDKQPWVYLACGHVHGYHDWGHRSERDHNTQRECPMCRTVGPYVPLWLGCEPAFYVDTGAPTHAFVPCGHVCSEKSTRYWAEIPLPHGTHAFHAACPFCAIQLNLTQKWSKLIFQGPVD
ncbi:E3 ubiquitin-protein ligase pellino -like protein 2 [Triplophysa tibetana]|uniref:E3 ubiquitin-protein ligase pellino-like protein 2 n=1 Tax=Triplophysa tibetana TaxID=1572043 RepID=A0A5A9NR48_9TELE|nr:E3 ubiquitin-protein ligase pellino -like protein 2 [Triplophysa tibetana]